MAAAEHRPRVLFLCTGNSCRSQMAEGWCRALHGGAIDAFSAGTSPGSLNALAVWAMREAGVDISRHRSKHPDDAAGEGSGAPFDLVVTVCDDAHEACPVFPGATRVIHRSFDDPPRLARDAKTHDEAMVIYRRVRDEIRAFVETLPGVLGIDARRSPNSERTLR